MWHATKLCHPRQQNSRKARIKSNNHSGQKEETMAANRSERMGAKKGVSGFIDRLRYNELARQGLGLLLVLICTLYAEPGREKILIGFGLAIVGQLWRIYAAGVIYKNRQLATTGAYSLVRHPLYLGNFLILVGFTLAGANWAVAIVVIGFFFFYYPAAIRYEDAKLEEIFGDAWRNWAKDIPAMFPFRLRWVSNQDADWDMKQSLIRNGELPISVYLIICAVILWYRAAV
jgi:hypothetical protein